MAKNYYEAIKNATEYEDAMEFIEAECPTYEAMGELFVQMLEYFADSEHDGRAAELLASMVIDYAGEVM